MENKKIKISNAMNGILEFLDHHIDEENDYFIDDFSIALECMEEVLQSIRCKDITEELIEMGFTDRKAQYLSEAIALAKQNPDQALKEIYHTIAERHGKSVEAVRKNIRDAIADVWFGVDAAKLKQRYPFEWSEINGRPSNAEFIENMVKMMEEERQG